MLEEACCQKSWMLWNQSCAEIHWSPSFTAQWASSKTLHEAVAQSLSCQCEQTCGFYIRNGTT